MTNKLKSDKDLKSALADFFAKAEQDEGFPTKGAGEKLSIFSNSERQFRMQNGVSFSVRPDTRRVAKGIIRKATKLLGSVAGHEEDISDILWGLAAGRVISQPRPPIAEVVDAAIHQIADQDARQFTFIDCNDLILFEPPAEKIEIGPVAAHLTDVFVNTDLKIHPDAKWRVTSGGDPAIIVCGDGSVECILTPACWVVQCEASRRNVLEQAAWLIDIAVGYLRLSHNDPFHPSIGEIEQIPNSPPLNRGTALILQGESCNIPGAETLGRYRVGADLLAIAQSDQFKARASKIFQAKKGSVGERVAQGLGWMTRSRRSADRAERLLYTFTAMEALLSSEDKHAPVVQTIARHAAVMLWKDPAGRAAGAKQLRELYTVRSALVHAGSRNVSKSHADTAQYLCEALYWQALDKVELSQTFANFSAQLAIASYGSPWPPGPASAAE